MIVGTAGHIDHGKTTLVRALTGVDTDRLPEEKRRGISIELGYAFLDTPQGARIGFIDVPGHERLVHTMLAGATGLDHALVLVAADDGVMPQTREHFAVVTLLGIGSASFVITKIDRADSSQIAQVRDQITSLAIDTPLAAAPVFEVCAQDGRGIDSLRAHLLSLDGSLARPDSESQEFRLAIDRVFVVEGTGTVVTGTVHSGRVAVGDELALTPSQQADLRARVRSVHAQGRAVQSAGPGERCALGLAGVARDQLSRGQWLVNPGIALSTRRFDAQIGVWPGETRALRSGAQVHVHIGAASTTGSVALLDEGDSLSPGRQARMQVVLHEPLSAWRGDRVILRDASASRTIAGGRILDPFAPARYRRTPQRMAELDALALDDARAREEAIITASPFGVDLSRLRCAAALASEASAASPDGASPLFESALHAKDGAALWVMHEQFAGLLRADALQALARYHEAHPDELGPDAARLRRLAAPRLQESLWKALLGGLQAQGTIAQRGSFVHLPEHGIRLSAVDERIAQKIAPMLAAAGFEGAWARDLARDAGESEPLMRVAIARLAQRGDVHQVVRDLVYDSSTLRRLAAIARAEAGQYDGVVTAARFRDATALGRKRAIQILEYFDRAGLLRRVGDEHRLRTDSQLFAD